MNKKLLAWIIGALLFNGIVFAEVVESDNLRIEYKWDSGRYIRLPYVGGWSEVDVKVTNIGDQVENGLIELGHNPGGLYSLFATITPQSTCNYKFPWNVHREYRNLQPGESVQFNLKTDAFDEGGCYRPYLLHTDNCCTVDGVSQVCSAREPLGWGIDLNGGKDVCFGNPELNENDQCDNDYEAEQYLRAKGTYNCASATCADPASPTSKAVCVDYECADGTKQTDVCDDGSSVTFRECVNNRWTLTGDTCPDTPPPPPPPDYKPGFLSSLSNLQVGLAAVGIIALIGLTIVFFKGGK